MTGEDVLASHLSVMPDCVDEYRELGRVEYLFIPAPEFVAPNTVHHGEAGLILAVSGTVRVRHRRTNSTTVWRIHFVDARHGQDRWAGRWETRKQAENAIVKARSDGEVELRKSGAKDWRKVNERQ